MTAPTTSAGGVNTAHCSGEGHPHGGPFLPAGVPAPPAFTSLVITAYGTPVTQGSIRSLGAGRPSVHSNAKRLKPWRTTVHEAALDAMRLHDRHEGPVQVRLLFCFDRPAGHLRTGRNAGRLRDTAPRWPITRSSGDIDKLARALLDALTDAGVFRDDSQVVDLRARKIWAGDEDALPIPGVRIDVRETS